MQAATTCLSWNISTARLARLRACMAAVSTSPPEEWQVAWERHMLECLSQCAAKAQEEGRHHVVKELRRLDALFRHAMLGENAQLKAAGRNTKLLTIPCTVSNDLPAWSEYLCSVGSFHRLDVERSLELVRCFSAAWSADGFQDLPEASWLATAEQELSKMLGVLLAHQPSHGSGPDLL